MADIKAVLIAWHAGERISALERVLGYTRPTVRKYIGVAQRLGVARVERAAISKGLALGSSRSRSKTAARSCVGCGP